MKKFPILTIFWILIFILFNSYQVQAGASAGRNEVRFLSKQSGGEPAELHPEKFENDAEQSIDMTEEQDQKKVPEEKKCENENVKAIVMRILLTRIRGELRVCSPDGVELSNTDGMVILEYRRCRNLIFSLEDGRISMRSQSGDIFIPQLPEKFLVSPLNPSQPLSINEKRYRGKLRVGKYKNLIELVNLVELEKYLYGVVPREFRTSYPEAARAQAVVARTFALIHRGKFEKEGFDFSSSSRFQVYGGVEAEDEVCTRAVEDTRGLVLTYNGNLVKYPLYHSTCGGATGCNESVFLTEPIPYLRSVRCALEEKKHDVEKNEKKDSAASHEDREDFLKNTKDSLCKDSSYFRWSVRWSHEEMLQNARDYTGDPGIERVNRVEVTRRGPSGRAVELVVDTDRGQLKIEGNRIRNFLKVNETRNGNDVRSPLYSTRFVLEAENNDNQRCWKAKGSGWGHGLGMCQFGALGLAKKGLNFKEILRKYYPGTRIKDYRELQPGGSKDFKSID